MFQCNGSAPGRIYGELAERIDRTVGYGFGQCMFGHIPAGDFNMQKPEMFAWATVVIHALGENPIVALALLVAILALVVALQK
jgi:hypothetical protein